MAGGVRVGHTTGFLQAGKDAADHTRCRPLGHDRRCGAADPGLGGIWDRQQHSHVALNLELPAVAEGSQGRRCAMPLMRAARVPVSSAAPTWFKLECIGYPAEQLLSRSSSASSQRHVLVSIGRALTTSFPRYAAPVEWVDQYGRPNEPGHRMGCWSYGWHQWRVVDLRDGRGLAASARLAPLKAAR